MSLAAALALPLETAAGAPFPQRELIIFLTFAVILATLVGQGLTLPLLIRRLALVRDGGDGHEEAQTRVLLAEAAIERMGRMSARWSGHTDLVDRLRAEYLHRVEHLDDRGGDDDRPASESEQERIEHREIMASITEAEREALLRLRDTGAITAEVFRRIERDLDLQQLRMEL